MQYIEEELTLAELSERFLLNNDFDTPSVYNMSDLGIEVLTLDSNGNERYCPILNYIVKESVENHYSDGKLKGTSNHRIIENGLEVYLKDHVDFLLIDSPMKVVDIEVQDEHTYLANGRLNHNTTSGGKSVPYHSSVRLRLQSIGQIKLKVDGRDEILGTQTRLTVKKNRCGPPLRVVDYDIYFDSGIDDYGAWLQIMKSYGIVHQGGSWYTYESQKTGEVVKFLSKDFREKLENDPELKKEIYERICDEYIMKYSSKDFGIDDIDVDTDVQSEES